MTTPAEIAELIIQQTEASKAAAAAAALAKKNAATIKEAEDIIKLEKHGYILPDDIRLEEREMAYAYRDGELESIKDMPELVLRSERVFITGNSKSDTNNKRQKFQRAVIESTKQLLGDLYKMLKQPNSNKPLQVWQSPSPPEIQYGMNYRQHCENTDNCIFYDGTMWRIAYATGSGNRSVCPDPKRLRILPMYDPMIDLCSYMDDLMNIYVQDHFPGAAFVIQNNSLAAKIYGKTYTRLKNVPRILESHCDNSFNVAGKGFKVHDYVIFDNSQEEMSFVAIITVGNLKRITFEAYTVGPDGKKCLAKGIDPIVIEQPHMSIVLLHPLDEYKQGSGKMWWQHKAELYYEDDVAVTFNVRTVKTVRRVYPVTGLLVEPHSAGPLKDVNFDEARWEFEHDFLAQEAADTEIEMFKEHLLKVLREKRTSNNPKIPAYIASNINS